MGGGGGGGSYCCVHAQEEEGKKPAEGSPCSALRAPSLCAAAPERVSQPGLCASSAFESVTRMGGMDGDGAWKGSWSRQEEQLPPHLLTITT